MHKLIQTIEIPALKGTKVIADSKLFSWIDSNFKSWGADKKVKSTKTMKLDVCEMIEDATFAQIMSKDNLLTQEQILYFIENHKDLLRQDYYSTFFPFKSGEEVFVARVVVGDGGGLEVGVGCFSDDFVWFAGCRRRFVVPQLTPRTSEQTLIPFDALTLAIAEVKKAGYIIYKQV